MKDDALSPMLAAAPAYAARGWKIFPANIEWDANKKRYNKKSYLKAETAPGGENWGMTADIEQLKINFNHPKWRKKCGIGIPTGKVNGIFVVEADTPKGHDVDGLAGLRDLEAKHGPLPVTLMAESPSGSLHHYFNRPAGVDIKNSTSELAPGVDVRGEGGMVIAPPSIRADGAYRWVNEGTPIADAPGWLIELVRKRHDGKASPNEGDLPPDYLLDEGPIGKSTDPRDYNSREADIAKVAAAMAVIPNNDVSQHKYNTIGMACWAATGGSDAGFELFDQWARESKKKYHGGTVERWKNYAKYPPTKIGAGSIFHWADEADQDWRDRIEQKPSEKKTTAAEPKSTEPKPIDLWAKFEPPSLPIGLMPSVIEDFALEQSELMGADPSGLAMAALTVCAAATPDYVRIKPKKHDIWTESARIWTALVGDPSSMKSPILRVAARPLIRMDAEKWREYLKAKAQYEKLSAEERKATDPPQQTRLRIEDTTIEGAQEVLIGSPNGVLLLQDELSGWFGSLDKYAGHRGAAKDRGFFLQSYNGGPYVIDRASRGRGHAIIENLSISILGAIQPEPMRKIADDTVDDGLMQRLLMIIIRPGLQGRDEPTGKATVQYDETVKRLQKMEEPFSELFFDNEARAIREQLETKHLELMSLESINKKLAAHIGKYNGLFARLNVLWHCIEEREGYCVTEKTARRVATFLHQFLLPHAIAFYAGMLGLSDDHDRLTAVAGYILARKLEWITPRDVTRGDRTMRGLKRFEVENILHQLAALGWVEMVAGKRRTDPPRWFVNEEVHKLFAERAAKEEERRSRERAMIVKLLGNSARRGDDD